MTLESALIPIPSEVIMPFAGFLVQAGNDYGNSVRRRASRDKQRRLYSHVDGRSSGRTSAVVCERKYHAGAESEELFKQAGVKLDFIHDEIQEYDNQ